MAIKETIIVEDIMHNNKLIDVEVDFIANLNDGWQYDDNMEGCSSDFEFEILSIINIDTLERIYIKDLNGKQITKIENEIENACSNI